MSEALVEAPTGGAGSGPSSAEREVRSGASKLEAAGEAAAPPVALEARDLKTYFFTYEGVVRALDGVSLLLRRGETTGLVGETGSGKSVTALTLTRLVPDPPGRIFSGHVYLDGADLLRGLETEATYRQVRGTKRVRVKRRFRRILHANERMEAVRGRGIAMIFQEPTQALNPVFSISNQVSEILFLHHGRAILDEMLAATPDAPAVAGALDALAEATRAGRAIAYRELAEELGRAAGSSRLATEAYYIADGPASPVVKRRRLMLAVDHLRLTPTQRRYLAHRRRLVDLRERTNDLRLRELRTGSAPEAEAFRLRARTTGERFSHFYFGLWGLRRWVRRPLDQELYWRVVRSLEGVRIANPDRVASGYPHELSGGMLQRVMIAMALSGDPAVLLADEPTTALDVTIQAQILELLDSLRKRVGTAILLITHDLAVVAEVADRVCVMYAGQIVERGPVKELFRRPLHPYTQSLLGSVPRVDRPDKELHAIPGTVPNLIDPPAGCRFHPRCPHAMPVCQGQRPPMTDEGSAHAVACYLYHGAAVGE